MAIEIAEVIETGPGWYRVRGTDGNIYTLQGDYNWRSNNPGNIEYGDFAISQGAIGSGAVPQGRERGFAIFPTLSAGEEARRALQFESPRYRDLTIEQAISRYAPPNENDTQGYINAVTRAAGVPAGTKMSDLTPQQQAAFLAAQSQMEGMRQGDILNAQGIRLPPNEIPNMVGTALSVVPTPRVAPTPETMTPDLALMRNPQMSSSARMAQVTPPLPQPRPVSPMDIARAPGTTVATIPTTMRPGQSPIERITPLPSAREIAMAPGTTIGTIPTTQRVSLPPLLPSNIGQPPTTRSVPSVPFNLQPTAREIAAAPGVTVATIPTTPTQPMNMRSRDSVANAALGQRVATQMGPAFNQPGFIPNRLAPNPIVQPSFVPLNQPPIQVVPSALPQLSSAVPLPRRRPLTPISPVQRTTQPMPRMAAPASPLRIVVNGGNMIQPQRTTVQSLQSSGLSPSDAYALANAQAAQRARDSATSPSHVSSNSWFNEVTGRA